jgi:hypothetical protein
MKDVNIAALYGAQADLNRLLEQRERIEIDIAKKRYQIAALMALTEQNEELYEEVGVNLGGLTSACLATFRSAAYTPLTPVEVRERLSLMGFPVEHYRNVMAAIHTVIGRLADSQRITSVTMPDGETAYRLALPKKALGGRSRHPRGDG